MHSAKLNNVDPQAWLADVLARINDHKITDHAGLLPWNWRCAFPSIAAQISINAISTAPHNWP
jgi:hypothetical protein